MISPVLPSYARAKLSFVKGEGSWLVEADGRRFLDFGFRHRGHGAGPRAPGARQGAKGSGRPALAHLEPLHRARAEALAERLVEHTFADTVFFCNSGTEAAELAIKMARKYRYESDAPERTTILTFEGVLPRPLHGGDFGGGRGEAGEGLRPSPARLQAIALRRPRRAPRRRRRAGRGRDHGRTRAGRKRHPPAPRPVPQGPARSLRRARASPDPRRDPVRHGAHRAPLRP
jgi:hypothetical protein